MFKKKTALNVRPEPPSFAEIMEDINSAESNDIIFAQYNTGMKGCPLSGSKGGYVIVVVFCLFTMHVSLGSGPL